MGIRYYAYAFGNDQTEAALANPRAFIGSDPLADAWGFEPHAMVATATLVQAVPEQDLLYLDKAWRHLQALTGPRSETGSARPAFRMFEGQVTMTDEGWIPWCRALVPDEVGLVARDLSDLAGDAAEEGLSRGGICRDEAGYVLHYLNRAKAFVTGLAREGRGMAYMIG